MTSIIESKISKKENPSYYQNKYESLEHQIQVIKKIIKILREYAIRMKVEVII